MNLRFKPYNLTALNAVFTTHAKDQNKSKFQVWTIPSFMNHKIVLYDYLEFALSQINLKR